MDMCLIYSIKIILEKSWPLTGEYPIQNKLQRILFPLDGPNNHHEATK